MTGIAEKGIIKKRCMSLSKLFLSAPVGFFFYKRENGRDRIGEDGKGV